jgi:predicted ribonuclease toxin of YeeF-YezG toxin-antitoxin module
MFTTIRPYAYARPIKNNLTLDTPKRLNFGLAFNKYLNELEDISNRKLHPIQRKWLKESIENRNYTRLNNEQRKQHRRRYNDVKKQIIQDWELNTGQKFPTYKSHVYNRHGEVIRMKGQRYDLHHIIACSWGGDNRWENLHPLKFPNEHQNGVHRKNGMFERIFET